MLGGFGAPEILQIAGPSVPSVPSVPSGPGLLVTGWEAQFGAVWCSLVQLLVGVFSLFTQEMIRSDG